MPLLSSTDLLDEMKRVKARVDRVILDQLLPSSGNPAEVDLLYRMMRDYPLRHAKGLRPFLCVTACRAADGEADRAMLTAACLELFQHWILIHDDIEDGSELRRGEPALHRKYTEALALNAGDALHARMWGALLANQTDLGPQTTLSVMQEFSKMVNETTEGQHMELSWVGDRRWDLRESDYYEMCTKKTAWYTVASPCRLGAIVAGAGSGVLDSLREFGLRLGVAFQIQDDALNLVGESKAYGKVKSDDILEGKRTLILLHTLKSCSPSERKKLVAVMDRPRARKTERDVEYVLSLFEKHGSVDYARARATRLMQEALATLSRTPWKGDKDATALLESFARFAVEREW